MKKKLYLIAGRTASGKSTIVNEVCKDMGLKRVKSYTTRPPRENEKKNPENADHYFISEDDVEKYKDDIAAYTKINGYEYFTTKQVLNDSDIYVIDPNGIESLKATCGDEYDFTVVDIIRDKEMMAKSFCERGESEEAFEKRYLSEDEQFTRFENGDEWNFMIANDESVEESVKILEKIIERGQK